nr:MAG TPA: hypothetical protein [Caudoviricetes sp.]
MNTINLCQAGISFLAFGGVGRFLNPTPVKRKKIFVLCLTKHYGGLSYSYDTLYVTTLLVVCQ